MELNESTLRKIDDLFEVTAASIDKSFAQGAKARIMKETARPRMPISPLTKKIAKQTREKAIQNLNQSAPVIYGK